MNAIERLRDWTPVVHGSREESDCPCVDCCDQREFLVDLAAVEALHQAAKAILGSDESIAFRAAMVAESPEFHGTDPFNALAAAVRRVEGQA